MLIQTAGGVPMCLCQIPSVSWNPGSVQVSLSATRVPALFPRQCGNNASKSAGAGKLLFVTFLSHKRGPGREGLGEQGEQVPVDILTPLPLLPSLPCPWWPRGDWRDLNPPHDDQPAARRSATPTTLLSPTPHKSFSDTPISDNSSRDQ